jgi:hypothetical protein
MAIDYSHAGADRLLAADRLPDGGLGDVNFLPFVDVSPSAPVHLADYKNPGLEHIVREKPDGVD